ncbi:PREDICTED: probable magnesium transporter NIPA8 [Nicotiana attenuata]|uniref:probable magnesium transporter NIPA8 n=1 Tax=Nicotiana attenuata TaxID=49451 RepID=UPI0009054856|nr:PREDICTED: probable magnesium transporter NIPA8 [Nicotiana attenuata]
MGEWVIAAIINLLGSIIINFGTNLLKLGHHERKKHSMNVKVPIKKPIIYFQTWRIGILFFAIGNCLNFISFGYAAQSLLAALGSIQFVSNIVFAYFLSNKTVTIKIVLATAFIVVGNIFLVAFGNHQSPVYMPEQLAENYTNITFLLYCLTLVLVIALHHSIYKRGEGQMLVPFSYTVVSGTGGFWMARLNEGLSRFDAILIVPMFQIAWTFFSICTGFVYFEEYKVFDTLRTTMFILGMISVFVGIYLLAPEDDESYSKGGEVLKDEKRLFMSSQDSQIKDIEIIWTSYGDESC